MKDIAKTKTCENEIPLEVPSYIIEVQQAQYESHDAKMKNENSAIDQPRIEPGVEKLNTESSIPKSGNPKKELPFLNINDVEIEEQNNTIAIKVLKL